jgi:hypothetical protein
VPVVCYQLWPETLRLLQQERTKKTSGLVLLNEDGKPLWSAEAAADGKLKRGDNIRDAFWRLQKKTGIAKPLKSFKKTAASLLRDNPRYASLEKLYLGHAPRSLSDRDRHGGGFGQRRADATDGRGRRQDLDQRRGCEPERRQRATGAAKRRSWGVAVATGAGLGGDRSGGGGLRM